MTTTKTNYLKDVPKASKYIKTFNVYFLNQNVVEHLNVIIKLSSDFKIERPLLQPKNASGGS